MKASFRVGTIAGLAILALASGHPRAAAKRPITEMDLFKFTWIADPEISPDGSTVAFVRVVVNEKDNRYESAIYTLPSTWRSAAATADVGHSRLFAALVA